MSHSWSRAPRGALRLGAALVLGTALAVVAPATTARADTGFTSGVAVGAVALGGWALGLAVAGTASYAMGSPWDDGWAAVELTTSCVLFAGAAALGIWALTLGLGNDAYSQWLVPAGLSVAPAVLGSYLLAHAVWSFATNDRGPPIGAWIAPADGGALAGVAGVL